MNNEWRDLPTMADVAAAQAAGDEIEHCQLNTMWNTWHGYTWSHYFKYRARPSQPKMKKVKLYGWFNTITGQFTANESCTPTEKTWIRYQKIDCEVEIQE